MGFLIVWIAVVVSVGALLAGWVLGPQASLPTLSSTVDPETAAVVLLVVVLALDGANSLRRRWRR